MKIRKGKCIVKFFEQKIKIHHDRVIFTIYIYRTKSSFLINKPQTQNFIQEILPGIQPWAQVNKTAIDMCNQQLEKMYRKLDMEKNRVLLEKKKLN